MVRSAPGLRIAQARIGNGAITESRGDPLRKKRRFDGAECQTAPRNSAEFQTAPRAERRQVPNGAKCHTARNAIRREMPCGVGRRQCEKVGAAGAAIGETVPGRRDSRNGKALAPRRNDHPHLTVVSPHVPALVRQWELVRRQRALLLELRVPVARGQCPYAPIPSLVLLGTSSPARTRGGEEWKVM